MKRLKFDLALLASGTVRVLELEAILPDGTAIALSYDETQSIDLSIRLDSIKDALSQEPQTIWLCLPVSRNMKMPEMAPRFLSLKTDPVEDEVSDAAPADIPRLIPNLSLATGQAPPALMVSMAIGGVFEDDGVIKLDHSLPALLDLHAAPELLEQFRARAGRFVFVVDEYGGTSGICTIEDVLEEIVGEIHDEHEPADEQPPLMVPAGDGRFEADGRVSISEVNERLGLSLPEDGDFDTVAGYLLDRFGRVPATGEREESPEATFVIIAAGPTKIDRVAIEMRAAEGGAVAARED